MTRNLGGGGGEGEVEDGLPLPLCLSLVGLGLVHQLSFGKKIQNLFVRYKKDMRNLATYIFLFFSFLLQIF